MIRPINTRCWEKFLTSKGYKYSRTSSSHDIWVKSSSRSIPVWGNEKQVPVLHLKTSCKTIGCSLDELFSWVDQNC